MTTLMLTDASTDPSTRRPRRVRLLLAGSAILAVAFPLTASAATDDVEPTQTGCLDRHGPGAGDLYNVATGSSPRRACRDGDGIVHLAAGDITSVAAGLGLRAVSDPSGIVDSEGSTQLDLAPTYRLPQDCLAERMVVQAAGGWACRTIPPASPTQILTGTSGRGEGSNNVSDDMSYLSDPLQVPAGTWNLNAVVGIYSSTGVACRLDADGVVGADQATTDDGARFTLTTAVTSPDPFTVSLACADYGEGAHWSHLTLTAVQGTSLNRQTLAEH